MPSRPELAGTVECIVTWAIPGTTVPKNVFNCYTASSFTTADLVALANTIKNAMQAGNTGVAKLLPNSVTVAEVECIQLTSPFQVGISNVATSSSGNPDNPLPPNVAYCVSWKIGTRYRGGHPRTYTPGIGEAAQATKGSSQVSAAFQTSMVNAWGALLAAINASGPSGGGSWQMGSMARQRTMVKGQPPTILNPPVFYPYVDVSGDLRLDSQRRRLGKA